MPRSERRRAGQAFPAPLPGRPFRLGRASAMTRDITCGVYTEIQIYDSQWPPQS